MQIDGTLVSYTNVETIQGNNGVINKCFMIIQTHGTYPKKVAIQFMNDKINLLQAVRYTEVRVYVNPSSNESNGRWFTNLDGWKVEPIPAATSAPAQNFGAPQPQPQPMTAQNMFGAPAANNWGQGSPQTPAPVQQPAWTPQPQPAPAPQFNAPQPQPQPQQFAAPAQPAQGQFFNPGAVQDVPF